MKGQVAAALIVAALFAGAAIGYYSGSFQTAETFTHVTTQSSTSESMSSSIVSTSCTILAEGQVIMQVVNSTTGSPIPSATVQAEFLAPECPPNPHTTSTSSPMATNGTGFVVFGGEVGDWYLTVNGYGYPVEVSTLPERNTCVTFGLPSGNTSITYSGTFESSCQFGLPPHHNTVTTTVTTTQVSTTTSLVKPSSGPLVILGASISHDLPQKALTFSYSKSLNSSSYVAIENNGTGTVTFTQLVLFLKYGNGAYTNAYNLLSYSLEPKALLYLEVSSLPLAAYAGEGFTVSVAFDNTSTQQFTNTFY